jgi:CRP/FNR family transcriptional regulator, anaerobic regulatory protein
MDNLAELFKNSFDPYFNAPIEVWETFAKSGDVIETKKNEVIKAHGKKEKFFYFILRGAGGVMLFNNNNYLCIDLCYAGDFFGDYFSFITDEVTELEVICFEPSTLFRIDKQRFEELGRTEYGSVITQIATQSLYIHKQTQQLDLLSKSAEQRYLEILEQQPHIHAKTPNKFIASYLGITPESFSRLQKKIK